MYICLKNLNLINNMFDKNKLITATVNTFGWCIAMVVAGLIVFLAAAILLMITANKWIFLTVGIISSIALVFIFEYNKAP